MKWKMNSSFEYFLSQAIDTYTDLLSQTEKTDDEMDQIESLFMEKIRNEEFEEVYLPIKELHSFKRLHDYKKEDVEMEEVAQGLIVVLNTGKEKIVLDGNHRINTLNDCHPDLKALVVIIDNDL